MSLEKLPCIIAVICSFSVAFGKLVQMLMVEVNHDLFHWRVQMLDGEIKF
jgi:hypothetical protein